jgi:hypothetical protein
MRMLELAKSVPTGRDQSGCQRRSVWTLYRVCAVRTPELRKRRKLTYCRSLGHDDFSICDFNALHVNNTCPLSR